MADISTGRQRGIVPFVDETTGRLPDQYLPQGVIDLQGELEQAVSDASQSATAAKNAVDGFGLEVGTTTTGDPGSDAAVEIQKNGTKYTANFTIPRGDVGPADSSIMDLATKTYSGKSVLGFGTIDGIIIDSDKKIGSLTYGRYIANNANIISDVPENKGVVSDYVELNIDNDADGVFIVTASRKYLTRIIGVYDENKDALGAYDSHDENIKPPSGTDSPQAFDNWVVPKASILLKYPSARYVRFGSYSDSHNAFPLKLLVWETNQINDIAQYVKYFDNNLSDVIDSSYSIGDQIFNKDEFTVSGIFISYAGDERSDPNSNATKAIMMSELPDVFHVKLGIGFDTRGIHIYDYFGNHLGTYDYYDIYKGLGRTEILDMFVYKTKLLALYPDAQFVRFCNYSGDSLPLDDVSVNQAVKTDRSQVSPQIGNVLYKKKYVICGDSFSAEIGSNEGYPYGKFIAERNDMTHVNLAIAGTTMSTDVESNNFCQYRYRDVPTDADYITLCYGLNEESRIPDHIGTKESTELDTLWGAWNFSLEYLITNMPYAKIGIIIADAWTSQTMHDTLVEIAKWWGIPYLDLKEDPQVPMGLGGRLPAGSVSDKAKELRRAAFAASDNHPNKKAHAYRSSIIENFLRSL